MVRKTARRGKRVLVIGFTYTKLDGSEGRHRRDASVQTTAAAQTEEASRASSEPSSSATPRSCAGPTVSRCGPPSPRRSLPSGGRRSAPHRVRAVGDVAVDVALVKSGVSVSTRANAFLALRSVAKFAVEAKSLAQMPRCFPLPKRGKRVPSAPPAPDVVAAIDAASCPEHRLVILLAAHAGLRKGEIRALRCGDVERAFFVTILLSGNVPVHVVRELVGHHDLATTQGYAAILAPDRSAAAGVLDRVYQTGRSGQPSRGARGRSGWGRCSGSVASRRGSACCGRRFAASGLTAVASGTF
ncbi:MAG: site-specific integrase [Minicystis sp.]